MIDDAARVRVLRALLGLSLKAFAARLGVSAGMVKHWEAGRYVPGKKGRFLLAKLCEREKVGFLPSGMPVPTDGFNLEAK